MMLGDTFASVLAAAQAGSAWAFRCLYDELAPPVAGWLRWQGVREAEDLTSEVFLGVFRGLGSFTGDEEAFRSWVFTIAHRRLVDERRRLMRRPEPLPLEASAERAGGNVEDEAITALDDGRVAEMLASLTPEQRQVVTLRILGGFDVEQVAAIVGRRPGAVRALQHRALTQLRRALTDTTADAIPPVMVDQAAAPDGTPPL
jgi:RNA polymerase sigma factor (sigma-70 family)